MHVNDHIGLRLVHEIHTSERKSFRACRRRWNWIHNDRYYPTVTAKPLEFGTAYHAAMEVYYNPDTWQFDRDVVAALATKKFVDECNEQRQIMLAANHAEYLEEDVQADYDERLELGKGMLNYYFTDVAPKLDKNWKPTKVEVEFMLPIPNPETGEDVIWCKCKQCESRQFDFWLKNRDAYNDYCTELGLTWSPSVIDWSGWQGLPVVYAGRIDMLAVDEQGNYWIFDWKTAARISEQYEFLDLDDQIMGYVWALRKLGLNIRGFVYHEQKKAFPTAPQKNKSVRMGRWFSVNKMQATDYESYLATVSVEDKAAYDAGLYNEFLDYLRVEGSPFYFRHQVYKSREECAEAEKNIGYEALDMTDPNLRIYPSPGRFGCNFCAFQEPCKEKNAQGDFMFLLENMFEKKEHYYLKAKPSTESKGAE
jgi:hypothetical protein